MAKRGRKKKSKVTSLSAADKAHLKRILGKVRQIKANKQASGQPTGKVNAQLVQQLTQLLATQEQNLNRFTSISGNFTSPAGITTFNQLAAAVAATRARLLQAQLGQIQK